MLVFLLILCLVVCTVVAYLAYAHYHKKTEVVNGSEQTIRQGQSWTVPGLEMQFAYVSPGSFQMGSKDFMNTSKPVHCVNISNGFWLGKYQVTQSEYESIIGRNQSSFKGGNKPVEQVSWDDAIRFCKRLTEIERTSGRLPSSYEYCLPTEAEWEFAARGGAACKSYKYSGSNNPDRVAWYKSNSGDTTHEVGTKVPNKLGIYDMSGNVSEWCLDNWHDNYDVAPTDGSRWGNGEGCYDRVIRGGSFCQSDSLCETTTRGCGLLDTRCNFVGFRVAINNTNNNTVKVIENKIQQATCRPLLDQSWMIPDLNVQFVYVAPGTFQMGATESDREKPVHTVTIIKGYWIGKYPVTQNEYQLIMGRSPSRFKGGNRPVDTVCWYDAASFCQELTWRAHDIGNLPSGYEYRLPTEAEWEFAARGGTASKGYKYSGSDDLDSVAWYNYNSEKTTHEVGTKSPNELGIYDMSGNVSELCLDDWHDNYDGAPNDGSSRKNGTPNFRAYRGGGWSNLASNCRIASRYSESPGYGHSFVGFRVALAPVLK